MMRKTVYTFVVLLLLGALMVSCSDKKQEAMKQQKDAYVSQVDGRLKAFDARMSDFEKKGETVPPERKEEFNKTVDALKQKRDAAGKSLEAAKTAEGAQWESAKTQTDAALQDLENSMNQAASTFP